jgi:very-short-patch-repair endonuclease
MSAGAGPAVPEGLDELIGSRIENLRPKLLDLTRRNPLISTRLSPRSNSLVRVVDELPDVIASYLAGEQRMRLVPLPPLEDDPRDEQSRAFQDALSNARLTDEVYLAGIEELKERDDEESAEVGRRLERELRDRIRADLGLGARQTRGELTLAQHARNNAIEPTYDLPNPNSEHQDGRHQDSDVQTLLLPDDLERKLNSLLTKCRTWIQETGINVLHASFGFLEWTEPNETEPSFAPLVLLPVEIEKVKTREGGEFWVKMAGDKAETNLVLAEKFRREFGIDLPKFESGSIEQYLQDISAASPTTMRWRVRRQVAFGIFPSARMAMYQDLDTKKTNFGRSNILSRLFGGGQPSGATPFADEYEIDEPQIEKKVPCLVLDADSSQFSTLVDIADGKNLSVEGPPGTGKSQTIVNVIAAAIAAGQKVLFVAEKMAALEVVKSRLEAIGVGEFLLPLQAERSTREAVINSLRDRLTMDPGKEPRDFEARIHKYKQIRSELAAHISVVSSAFARTGLTVYDVLGKCIATNSVLDTAPRALQAPLIPDIADWGAVKRETIKEIGSSIRKARRETAQSASYWRDIKIVSADRFSVARLTELASEASDAFREAADAENALRPFHIEAANSEGELVRLLDGLNGIAPLLPELDVQLLAVAHRASHLATLTDFFESCRTYREAATGLASLLADPEADGVADRARTLHRLCSDYNITSLDASDWAATLSAIDQLLVAERALHDRLKPFVDLFPAAATISIDVIRQAGVLASSEHHHVLALRSERTADVSVVGLIRELAQTGAALHRHKLRLEQAIAVDADCSIAELRAHAAALRGARWFSFLSPSYRSARRVYAEHSRRPYFKLQEAAQTLYDLAEFKKAAQAFTELEQARTLFGLHFRGIDTEFEQFERLVSFYETVETRFPGVLLREVRHLLKVGALDLVHSIPRLPEESLSGSFSDLVIRIERRQQDLARQQAVVRELQSLTSTLSAAPHVNVQDLPHLADRIDRLLEIKAMLDSHETAESLLHIGFSGANTNPSDYDKTIEALKILERQRQCSLIIVTLLEASRVEDATSVLSQAISARRKANTLLATLSAEIGVDLHKRHLDDTFAQIADRLAEAGQDANGIYSNVTYASTCADLREHGLGWILDTLQEQARSFDDLPDLIEAVLYRAMAIRLYEIHGTILRRYRGDTLNDRRSELANLDRDIIKLSRQKLRVTAHKASRPPAGIGYGRKSTWTDMALIQNEISKKQKHVPVRDLTRRAARALLELKPCWMMSPLAVAQYLPLGQLEFDLCIIDEASQMPPEDAVGALARCRQTMVVGDTNQLPPTSFFRKMLEDDEADEDETVLEESILEMANGAFRPARRLRWHYRSRHSGLIRFSNEHIYDNNLIVFPSAFEGTPNMGISLVAVQGRYHASVNSDEASAMIEAILRFMRSSPDRSLGVVTLNQKQRDLLLEEMETALSRDTVATKYVDDWTTRNNGLESFFIKNLENVQGDERDVIFIGTVYGPEKPGGPVMQRFGPINGLAGRRRLNVLFSRAKEQIVTFSSMTAADVRADEDGNAGAYLLKQWLEYSATGRIHVGEGTGREPDSDFEIFVINQIRSMGCIPVPQVGVAGYFVDIGVQHPEWPHGFILGVECDGASYHSSRSARDRDRLREEVLLRLGWKLHRIWSTDWFNDPQKQAERLRAVIDARIKGLREERSKNTALSPEQPIALTPPPEIDQSDLFEPPQASGGSFIELGDVVSIRYLTGTRSTLTVTLSSKKNDPSNGIVHANEPLGTALLGAEEGDEIEILVGSLIRRAVIEQVDKTGAQTPEKSAQAPLGLVFPQQREMSDEASELPSNKGGNLHEDVLNTLDRAKFYETEYRHVLQELGVYNIDRLGPITFKHLSDIIARVHGFQRTGSEIKRQIWSAISRSRRSSRTPNGHVVFWPNEMSPVESFEFRGLTVNGDVRAWSDVPYPEQLSLAIAVLRSGSLQDPAAAIGARIGLTRLREATRDELEKLVAAAREAIAKGLEIDR